MKIVPIRTHKIIGKEDILSVISRYVKKIKENSILAITSKIVSICEGSVVKKNGCSKKEFIRQECEYYLPSESNKYHATVTIKDNIIVSSAGIDESNGNGYYVFWPRDAQQSANKIRTYLAKKFKLKNFGVIITDSKSTLLRRGTTGTAIAWSGFLPLKSYLGEKDLFGKVSLDEIRSNVADGLAAIASVVMGEGAEQTPMAVISEIKNMNFQKRNPTEKEIRELKVSMDDDYFKSLLESVKWQKGGRKK